MELVITAVPGAGRSAVELVFFTILPALGKYLAGGTAMMGVMGEPLRDGQIDSAELNRSIGFLRNPLDLPGLAILLSTGPGRLCGIFAEMKLAPSYAVHRG